MTSTISHQTTTQKTTPSLTEASTHVTSTTVTTTKLDACPDEILLHIAEFTGAHSWHLGYGIVNKRINQIFNTYNNKLTKTTSYGGYASFKEIVEKYETELEREMEYRPCDIPNIFYKLASGAVSFNRTDLLNWAVEKQNKHVFRAICVRAIKARKRSIMKKVWGSIKDESLMAYMKANTHFTRTTAKKGNLDCLVYLCEELECGWDKKACSEAARSGHLDCLVYLYTRMGVDGMRMLAMQQLVKVI